MRIDRLSILRRWHHRFRSRSLGDAEFRFHRLDSREEIGIDFFADRTPLAIQLRVFDQTVPSVVAVHSRRDGDWRELDYVQDHAPDGAIRLRLQTLLAAETVRITLDRPVEQLEIAVAAHKTPTPDIAMLSRALYWHAHRDWRAAIMGFERYCRIYSEQNAFVLYQLADCHLQLEEFRQAEHHALRACAVGNVEVCRQLYQAVQHHRPAEPVESLRRLQERAKGWPASDDRGVVVLESRREIDLGVGHNQRAEIRREVIEVRDASAGRQMQFVGYGFDERNDIVLHASARIIRKNDDIEVLPSDRMQIRDARDGNPLITLERPRVLSWILPDIEDGDLVETRFDMLRRGQMIDGEPWPGYVFAFYSGHGPSLRSTIAIEAPKDLELDMVTRNCSGPIRFMDGISGNSRAVVSVEFHENRQRVGDPEPALLHNPVVVVGPKDRTWAELSGRLLRSLLSDEADDPVPDRLAAILAAEPDPRAALERCFYMVRDELKYAATAAAKEKIGVAGRADEILRSGVGDCSDKSYLLHLVCRDLGLVHHFFLVDTRTQVVFEEIPLSTFDHALLRVEVDDQVLWLDAAADDGVFGAPPPHLQGAQGLLLDEKGTTTAIPDVEPHQNRMCIREWLENCDDGQLAGDFEIEAEGLAARQLAQHLGPALLGTANREQRLSWAMLQIMPGIHIQQIDLVPDFSDPSAVCRIRARHRRGQLSRLVDSAERITALTWRLPYLPHHYWTQLEHDRPVALGIPGSLRIEVELGAGLAGSLRDRSSVDEADNPLYAVSESSRWQDGRLVLRRDLLLRHRASSDGTCGLVPDLARSTDQATRLTLRFAPEQELAAGGE